jgi:RNA polymerase sigma-70 factor (ECF subfamily)
MSYSPPPHSEGDFALVQRAKEGDAAAYDALCCKYSSRLRTFLWHMLNNEEEARDITQETLLTGWIKIRSLRENSYFKSWLYGIATNQARAIIRRNRRFRWLSLEEHGQLVVADRVSLVDIEAQLAESEQLRLALEYLSPTYRACVLLQIVADFKQAEIAEMLGIPRDNISTNVKRGLARLAEVYQALEEEREIAMKMKRRQV